MDKKEAIDRIIKDSQKYAEKNRFKLNPDKNIVRFVAEGLAENEKNLGARFCPCRTFAGNKKDSICPCKWHRQEIKTKGRCHCGLFVKNIEK